MEKEFLNRWELWTIVAIGLLAIGLALFLFFVAPVVE